MQSLVRHPAGAAVAAALLVGATAAAGARLGLVATALAAPAALAGAWLRGRLRVAARRLHRISREDALTGLGNRVLLRERLEYEIVRHARQERPLAALALDFDESSDEVLAATARALRRAVRAQDTVARVGGDALCVLAPETDRYAATQLAARVEAAVAVAVGAAGPGSPAASVGVALYPHDARGPQELLAHARAAALQATRETRERTGRRAARAA